MPTRGSPERDRAFELYEEHYKKYKQEMPNDLIAESLGYTGEDIKKKSKTISSWKSKHQWREAVGIKAKKNQKKPRKRGAPKGNRNAKGNAGGPGAPEGNQFNLRHGLYSEIIPEEVMMVVNALPQDDVSIRLEMAWTAIKLTYAQMIRSNKIMHTADEHHNTEILKRQKESQSMQSDSWEKEWLIETAHEKQGRFINLFSSAGVKLMKMIAEYEKLCQTKKQQNLMDERLRSLKLDTAYKKIRNAQYEEDETSDKEGLDELKKALGLSVEEVWSDEEA